MYYILRCTYEVNFQGIFFFVFGGAELAVFFQSENGNIPNGQF